MSYLRLAKEENPFLGYRAVRMYPEFHTLVRTQMRALVRASASGQLRVMVPMISRLDEVSWVKQMIAEEQERCAGAPVSPIDAGMQLGAMIEVPSMAFALDHFCRDLDFFSIGTNDLLQYFLAVDRAATGSRRLYEPMTPAFLRLLKKIADDVHAAGRWIGVCGELGGRSRALPLLVGMGFDELSMAAPGIAAAKAGVRIAGRRVVPGRCSARPWRANREREVEELLGDVRRETAPSTGHAGAGHARRGVRHPRGGDQEDRRPAVRHRADGRPARRRGRGVAARKRLLDRVRSWVRDPTLQVQCGNANSLAILRLRQPVEWASLDGQPVSVLILLAIRESDQATEHLKILATLARQVMHEEFRDRLAGTEPVAETVVLDFLLRYLSPAPPKEALNP